MMKVENDCSRVDSLGKKPLLSFAVPFQDSREFIRILALSFQPRRDNNPSEGDSLHIACAEGQKNNFYE
jgi:hypothetical protein